MKQREATMTIMISEFRSTLIYPWLYNVELALP